MSLARPHRPLVAVAVVVVLAPWLLVGAQAALVAALVVVAVYGVLAIGFGELPGRRPLRVADRLAVVALVAYVAQVIHALEHGIQLAYWVANPTEAPYLTPWAAQGAAAAATATASGSAVGLELLHLGGNAVFFVGIVAVSVLLGRRGVSPTATPWTRRALLVQGVHVTEHLVLVVTAAASGSAIGVSTLFGLLEGPTLAGPPAWGFRVVLHFAINAVATHAALLSLREVRSAGLLGTGSPMGSTGGEVRKLPARAPLVT